MAGFDQSTVAIYLMVVLLMLKIENNENRKRPCVSAFDRCNKKGKF